MRPLVYCGAALARLKAIHAKHAPQQLRDQSRAHHVGANANRAGESAAPAKPKLADAWPHAWRLIRPRRKLLAVGFVLMIINRFCGLALPAASKPFVDGVLINHKSNMLLLIIAFVLGATLIQATTSYSLTQLLSKAAQRLIADLRKQVQAAYRTPLGQLLRRQSHRQPGVAHHDRCRRRAQPDRHRAGRLCRRHPDGGSRFLRPHAHQRRRSR